MFDWQRFCTKRSAAHYSRRIQHERDEYGYITCRLLGPEHLETRRIGTSGRLRGLLSPNHKKEYCLPTLSNYLAAISTLAELCKVYVYFASDVQRPFLSFTGVKLQGQPSSSGMIRLLLFINILLFTWLTSREA